MEATEGHSRKHRLNAREESIIADKVLEYQSIGTQLDHYSILYVVKVFVETLPHASCKTNGQRIYKYLSSKYWLS